MRINTALVHGGARVEYDTKDTAGCIRYALKAAFPRVRFSVRTQYGSMYAAINIRWTDGPTEPQVEAVTDRFSSKTFDGYDDSTHDHEQINPDGSRVQYSGWINLSRQYSPILTARAYQRACQDAGLEPRADGNPWTDDRLHGDYPIRTLTHIVLAHQEGA